MNYLEAIFLGLVQGLSEFLPISSSGHLVIFQQLFGLSDDIAANMLFDVLVHIGTLVAVFVAFRHRIWRLIKAVGGIVADLCRGRFSFRKADEDKRMVILVLVATAVLVPFIPFRGYLEILFSSMLTVGIALLFTALLLSFADRVKKGNKTMKDMKVRDALIVGAFQGVALTPGHLPFGFDHYLRPAVRPDPFQRGGVLLHPLHPRHSGQRSAAFVRCGAHAL